MARTVLCFTEAFEKPKALSDLVVFSDDRPYVPAGDLSPYLKYCSIYAREHKVFLVPHRFMVDNVLYLCLFDPKGSIVGYQGALHRNLSTQSKQEQYEQVHVMQTSVGNLFLCVDTDIYYPEVLRLAKLKARILSFPPSIFTLMISNRSALPPAYGMPHSRMVCMWQAAATHFLPLPHRGSVLLTAPVSLCSRNTRRICSANSTSTSWNVPLWAAILRSS